MRSLSLEQKETAKAQRAPRSAKLQDAGLLGHAARFSEGVEIGEESLYFGLAERLWRHEGAAVFYGCGDAVVVGWSAAGKIGLLEDAEQGGAVQRAGLAVEMTLRAVLIEDDTALGFFGCELVERLGWLQMMAAREQRGGCDGRGKREGRREAAAGAKRGFHRLERV